MSCECFQIGGPFIGVDPDCEIHCKGGYEDRVAKLETENKQLKEYLLEVKQAASRCEDENEQLRRPACGTEQVWLDQIRHDDDQALLWFRAMQRESEDKKKAMEDAERYRWLRDNPEHESLPYYEDGKWCFPYQIYGHGGTGGGVALRSFDTLDAAIDAAMEGK